MYSLDINFLNDRPEYKPDASRRFKGKAAAPTDTRKPLIYGAIAGLLPLLLGLGAWFFLQRQNDELAQQSTELDSQLQNLQASKQKLEATQTQVKNVRDETRSLASVFDNIKPWSALLRDIADRTPANVRVFQIRQLPPDRVTATPTATPSPAPGGAPAAAPASTQPPVRVELVGEAASFNDVNDFLLVLKKSELLNANETRIVSAEQETENRTVTSLNLPGTQSRAGGLPTLPRLIRFRIQTALNGVPSSELLQTLDSKGAAGLVTRIDALKKKGAIQQP